MKKIIIIVIAIMLMIVIPIMLMIGPTSFGNINIGFGSYTFRRVHIFTHTGQDKCVEIQSWHDDELGIEVHTKEYGALYLSEGTYMLCESECPICGR